MIIPSLSRQGETDDYSTPTMAGRIPPLTWQRETRLFHPYHGMGKQMIIPYLSFNGKTDDYSTPLMAKRNMIIPPLSWQDR